MANPALFATAGPGWLLMLVAIGWTVHEAVRKEPAAKLG